MSMTLREHEIHHALVHCNITYGDYMPCEYCDVCPYARYGSACLNNLMVDAANTIKFLTSTRGIG